MRSVTYDDCTDAFMTSAAAAAGKGTSGDQACKDGCMDEGRERRSPATGRPAGAPLLAKDGATNAIGKGGSIGVAPTLGW